MEKKDVTLHYFIPEEWLSQPNALVRVTAYRIVNSGDFQPDRTNQVIDFSSQVRAVLIVGDISYSTFDHEFDIQGQEQTLGIKVLPKSHQKKGTWLILFQPFEDKKNINSALDISLSSCVGIYLAIFGRSMAFEQQFQMLVSSDTTQMHGPAMINPNFLGKMNLGPERFELMNTVLRRIGSLEESDRDRIQLSLHWFERGVRQNGTDALLSLWIAIEALAMKGTDISELKRMLKEIYSEEEVERRFQVGRIFGLRSKIVHQGLIRSFNGRLLDFLEMMFMDVLLHMLKIEPMYHMKRYLDRSQLNIEDLTSS